ncbi:MAG: relaxase/mobilization nuclease domain-containing protein, partial [bacterium]|nr:relaxase/mobilization nuclease domain-containing protein [bacterium]
MFVKILSRKNPSFKQLAEYIIKDKVPGNKAKDIIKHNIKGNTIDAIVKEFERNESFRKIHRSDSIKIFHEILSLSSNEEGYISDEVIVDLTKKYIELRGFKNVYLGAVHRDQSHVHSHLMVSALEYFTGKSVHITKSQLQDIKLELQKYHTLTYPELTESICNHGLGKSWVTDRKYYEKNKHERARTKDSVQEKVKELFNQSKTFEDFLSSLRENGLHHYERGGNPTGIMVDETKIRFTRLGITKEEIEQLKQPEIKQEEKTIPNTEPIKLKNMKPTEINYPIDTEDTLYNFPIDSLIKYQNTENL